MSLPALARSPIARLLLAALCLAALLLAGCGAEAEPAAESTATPEATGTSTKTDEDPAGTYVGEFGATLDLKEYGTLNATVPLTIEIAEDGSAEASWEYETEVPMPDVDTASTAAKLNGGLEGTRFAASGKATLDLEGPAGSLSDTFGARLDGQLSFGTIIGTVEVYGETEEFVVEKQ